jgi:hypothetical protein
MIDGWSPAAPKQSWTAIPTGLLPLVGPKKPNMIEQATYIYRKGWDLTRRRKTIPEACEGTEIPSNASGNRRHLTQSNRLRRAYPS